ncbi:CapA family protein [Chloroflexota bacterium]
MDVGADLILASHAHILKGIEQYNGKWIFHGPGNFVISTDELS